MSPAVIYCMTKGSRLGNREHLQEQTKRYNFDTAKPKKLVSAADLGGLLSSKGVSECALQTL